MQIKYVIQSQYLRLQKQYCLGRFLYKIVFYDDMIFQKPEGAINDLMKLKEKPMQFLQTATSLLPAV